MLSIASLLALAGGFFVIAGISETAKRLRLRAEGITDDEEIMRLNELSNRIQEIVRSTAEAVKNCSECFHVLSQTKFRRSFSPLPLTARDPIWLSARQKVISLAKAGFNLADRFLRFSVDSEVLKLREIFRHVMRTCASCPLAGARSRRGECPIADVLSIDESIETEEPAQEWISPEQG